MLLTLFFAFIFVYTENNSCVFRTCSENGTVDSGACPMYESQFMRRLQERHFSSLELIYLLLSSCYLVDSIVTEALVCMDARWFGGCLVNLQAVQIS